MLGVASLVVNDHPGAEQQGEEATAGAKSRGRDERGHVFGGILGLEDVAGDDAHEVRHGDADAGQHHALVLVGNVVVVPHVEDDAGGARAPCHHKACVVRDVELRVDVDRGVDDEADAGEGKAECDEGEAEARVVGCKGQDEEHRRARDVGGHGVEIRLDGGVAESLDDDRQEERHGLQWYTQADFDPEDDPTGWVLEDGHCRSEIEFLSDDGGRIDLNSVECQLFLLWCQEFGALCIPRQVPEGEEREQNGAAAFDDEEVSPVGDATGVDLENAIRQEAAKGRRD